MKHVKMYIEYLKQDKDSPANTVESYSVDLRQFSKFIGLSTLFATTEDIISFMRNLKSKGMVASTRNRKLASIKAFYKYLLVQGLVSFNPAERVEAVSEATVLPRLITIEEYGLLIDTIDNTKDKALVELLFNTGLRRSEAANLRRSQLNMNTRRITVKNGKGAKDRIIPFVPDYMPNVMLWLSLHGSAWVFPSPIKQNYPHAIRWVNSVIDRWTERAGLSDEITPHSFRRAFGTYLYENGADIKAIQEMLGHDSIDTTNLYVRSSAKRIQAELESAHPLANLKQ